MASNDQTRGQEQARHQYSSVAVKTRLKEGTLSWAKDAVTGILSSVAVVLVGLLLVNLGLAQEGQEFDFSLLQPYEFWTSFSGLVVEWSQWNEWLLLGLGLVALALTLLVYVRWRKARRAEEVEAQGGKRSLLSWAEGSLSSLNAVGALGVLAALFLGAYVYQQYLWNVELPVPEEQIGVAFTRQVGGSVAQEKLADYLRQMGHEGRIAMRELPVTFDARDTEQARQLAKRIGADAVVIYRAETGDAGAAAQTRVPGLAAPSAQSGSRYVAYIVFADPSLGLEIPVPQRSVEGKVEAVEFRTKSGVETPRLEASDLSRLMEASAGILMYDNDRYLPAIAHLRNAASDAEAGSSSDALVHFYLGSAYYLVDEDAKSAEAYNAAIEIYEGVERLSVQDRLLLASSYNNQADLLFYNRQQDSDLDVAEALLKKAIALREPLDKDQSALADPATFRRAHSAFGSAYIGLMQIAQYRKDEDAVSLWAERAKAEAEALMSKPDDERARTSAIWMQYRTGSCEDAYKLAYEMVEQSPNDTDAHSLLQRIASVRGGSGGFISTEAKQHLDRLLDIDPDSLPDLQSLLLYYTLLQYFRDPAYIEQVKTTTDRILEVDPGNVEALESYVSSVINTNALVVLESDPTNFFMPTGDARTFRKLRANWMADSARIKEAVEALDPARPYVTRWAEELQPQSAKPLIHAARLDVRVELYLYAHLYVYGGDGGAGLAEMYTPAWERARQSAAEILDPRRNPTDYEQLEAHQLLANLWSHKFWVNFFNKSDPAAPAAAKEAIEEAIKEMDAALKILEAPPPATDQEVNAAMSAYIELASIAIIAKTHYTSQGDNAQADEYGALFATLSGEWQKLGQQSLAQTRTDEEYIGRVTCPTGQLPTQAREASAQGDNAKAVELMEQYVGHYPHDPEGQVDLGWFRYKVGDLDGALESTRKAEELAPEYPFAPANRSIILLAQGKSAEAQEAISAMFGDLEQWPLAQHLHFLTLHSADLVEVARDRAEARDGVKAALPQLEEHVKGLPAEARSHWGSLLMLVENNLGAAAIWAGDYEAAKRLIEAALSINPDHVIARTNLGAIFVLTGDAAGAQREYSRAIEATASYLKDAEGKELEGDARQAAAQEAKTELEIAASALEKLSQQKAELQSTGQQLVGMLRQAAAGFAD